MSDDDLTVVYLWAKKEAEDEIEQLREALREIADQCKNTGYGSAIVMERMIDRIESIVIAALGEKK